MNYLHFRHDAPFLFFCCCCCCCFSCCPGLLSFGKLNFLHFLLSYTLCFHSFYYILSTGKFCLATARATAEIIAQQCFAIFTFSFIARKLFRLNGMEKKWNYPDSISLHLLSTFSLSLSLLENNKASTIANYLFSQAWWSLETFLLLDSFV